MNKKKKILNYQQLAVENAIEFLEDNDEFNFQSPTGSGKTFIVADIIDKYLENKILNSKPTTFLFIAPSTGKLDYQGYEKITKYLEDQWVSGFSTNYIGTKDKITKGSYLENIDYFKQNNVYFLGWSLFGKNTKIMNIESERNDLHKVISNTKMKDINIVLIIDEAHREVNTLNIAEMKKIVMNSLKPIKTIKISATLDIKPDYKIFIEEVIEECSIKKMVEIHGESSSLNFDKYTDETERLILSAIEQQKKIKKEYFKKNIEINPLLTIQIPNKIVVDKDIDTEDYLLKKIEELLDKEGYKKDFNYALWLDGNKTKKSKSEIVASDSPIEILIFKQAIAIGWDIPRANMLVRIRETKKDSFNIQTLGRIMRNPFFKFYDNAYIDHAFVFTKDENYKNFIKKEIFYIDKEETLKLERSERSINKNIKLNKIIINDKSMNQKEMIDIISKEIIGMKEFKKYLIFEHKKQTDPNSRHSSNDIFQENQDKTVEKLNENISSQQKLKFDGGNVTLFDLYIKYKTTISNNYLIQQIMDKISLKIKNIKIKQFYWATYYNFNKSIFSSNLQNYSIEEIINQEIYKYQKNKSHTNVEEYILPTQYETSNKYFDVDAWDKYNTFNASLKINKPTLSENEYEFCKDIRGILKSSEKQMHLFRNGTGKQDFYINYFNNISKSSKFFPDFILINETTKKIIIIEVKGRNDGDIDKETKNKMDKLHKEIDKISHKNPYIVVAGYKAVYNKQNEMEYTDKTNERIDLAEIINNLK